MVAPTKFCHIVYKTNRYEEMLKWYLSVFEAKLQYRDDRLSFFTYDEEHHRFVLVNMGPAPENAPLANEEAQRVAHVAYAWKNLGELLDTYKRLKALNVKPPKPIRHGLTLSLYYSDPDGNSLEFQIDLLDPDTANTFMASPAFGKNPVGESFDPDALVESYERGEPVDALIFRSDQPESQGANYVMGKPEPSFA